MKLQNLHDIEALATEVYDNRYAIINEKLIDLTSFTGADDGREYHIISVYKAEGCHNATCSADHVMSEEYFLEAYCFNDETEGQAMFLKLISDYLKGE